MKLLLALLTFAICSLPSEAGLPPTSTKGSGDSNPVVSFELDTPNIPITHTGTKASLGTVAVGGGGTGTTSLTSNNVILGNGASAVQFVAPSTSGNVLTSTGTTWTSSAPAAATVTKIPPTVQKFTSGSGTYNLDYAFVISSGSATVGATYTNNAVTFTVYATVSSATLVYMSGSGAPASSGTLTKSSGTGDATLTFSAFSAPSYLRVQMVGGGGGGAGSGSGATNGTAGNNTTFGTSLLTANGGALGSASNNGGAGGSATVSSPAVGLALTGGGGQGGGISNGQANVSFGGGQGGSSCLGGGGSGGQNGQIGQAGATNTGGGGGGGGGSGASGAYSGEGGGSGGCIIAVIPSPSATYSYTVAASANGGSGGIVGGGAGASGVILVEELYY